MNNLTSNIISIGQQLKVSPDTNIGGNESIYTVKKGDSLWSIANRFGVTVNDLINYNNLSSLTIQIGQQLRIPSPSLTYYTVERGDTLWSIARKYNVTVDQLMAKNNLTSNVLSIGQQLIIP